MEYTIVRGNENNKFDLIKKHGIWALHFKRRLKKEGTFDIIINGHPTNTTNLTDNDIWDKPLTLRVRLIVTE